MDLRERTFNELAIISHLSKSNSLSYLQGITGMSPLMLHNCMVQAERDGKIKYDRKHANFQLDEEVALNKLAITESTANFVEAIEYFIAEANDRESDITIDELQNLTGMADDILIRLAVFKSPLLSSYELSPVGDKETVYTFVTLTENADRQWGLKQLKPKKKGIKISVSNEK